MFLYSSFHFLQRRVRDIETVLSHSLTPYPHSTILSTREYLPFPFFKAQAVDVVSVALQYRLQNKQHKGKEN